MKQSIKRKSMTILCKLVMVWVILLPLSLDRLWAAPGLKVYERWPSEPLYPPRMPVQFGIKGWGLLTMGLLPKPLAMECAIGPFLDWRFSSLFGLQTGLMYSYQEGIAVMSEINAEAAQPMDVLKGIMTDMQHKSTKKKSENTLPQLPHFNNRYRIALQYIALHTLGIPIQLRIYPEKTKQLALYFGIRFLKHLKAKNIADLVRMKLGNQQKYEVLKQGLNTGALQKIIAIGSKHINEPIDLKNVNYGWWAVDFGFEFHGTTGFILGCNKIGIVAGYDATKLFIKNKNIDQV